MGHLRKLLLGLALVFGLPPAAWAVLTSVLIGDANLSVNVNTSNLITSVAFTAARTVTLPSAGGTCVGQTCGNALQIFDTANAVTSTNTLTIAPASGETINGNAANLILNAAGVRVVLIPTSGSNWQAIVEGDYVAATLASGSAVSVTTATPINVTSQSLSQGDWECRASIARVVGASTSFTKLSGSLGTTTGALVADGTDASSYFATAANVMAAGTNTKIGPARFSLAATSTIFLVVQDTFSVSTDTAFGQIECRRVR